MSTSAGAKVLVVDDTPHNVKLLADLLSVKGYAVATAATGEEALAKLAAERWVGIHWPTEYGGRGGTPTMKAIYDQEMALANAPATVNPLGLTFLAPLLAAVPLSATVQPGETADLSLTFTAPERPISRTPWTTRWCRQTTAGCSMRR